MAKRTISELAKLMSAQTVLADPELKVKQLLYDSRQLYTAHEVLFIALVGKNHDGHRFIPELAQKGVRNFCVSQSPENIIDGCNYLVVEDTLRALQELAKSIRALSEARIVSITGSNGKTTVKSWLTQILRNNFRVCSTPKSYNSQIGVPLSVWELDSKDEIGVFEAGISRPDEMLRLQEILQPEIGIFTNLGSAHDEFFHSKEQKLAEKLRLFENAKFLVYQKSHSQLSSAIEKFAASHNVRLWSWSYKDSAADLLIKEWRNQGDWCIGFAVYHGRKLTLKAPFTDNASLENLAHCWLLALKLGMNEGEIQTVVSDLSPVAMRLEMKSGLNNSLLINDTYNADLESLSVALNFQKNHSGNAERILIISEMLQTGLSAGELNQKMGSIINGFNLQRVIGIGSELKAELLALRAPVDLYRTTEDFMDDIFRYQFAGKSILIKGARHYKLEKLIQRLESKTHDTVLNIHLDRMVNNLNYFRAKLNADTKLMAMVKAFSYGSGTVEIAKLMEFHKVDYLGVAYADEGIVLRKAGIKIPIMVMNPELDTYSDLIAYELEPEIFNLNRLKLFASAVREKGFNKGFPIHIKLETGMNRLGFSPHELPALLKELSGMPELKVKSVFSHLAASDDLSERDFTLKQITTFKEMCETLKAELGYRFMAHICNSGGVSNYPEAQLDMIRLGIGLYGITSNKTDSGFLQPVNELYASVSQVKHVEAGDTVGYGRSYIAKEAKDIAVISIGYADGFRRSLSNGIGQVFIGNHAFPVIGRVCMDMMMVDITGSEVKEGDRVEIFGPNISIHDLARRMDTIPYEVLTGIGQRVKRVYFMD